MVSDHASCSKIKHKNVLRFHGVCIDEEPFYLIMEYMADGDLLRYLRETRPENGHRRQGAELRDALDICLDIARGCAHLEHCKFIHRCAHEPQMCQPCSSDHSSRTLLF